MRMNGFNDINMKDLFKPMSEEEIMEEKRKEHERQTYYEKVKENFLNLARSLPGREYETLNDPIVCIKGDVIDGKIVNLRTLTSSKSLDECFSNTFGDDTNYFEYTIDNKINVNSKTIPDNLQEILSWILEVNKEGEIKDERKKCK